MAAAQTDGTSPSFKLVKLDGKSVGFAPGEIRCFVCARNELIRLPYFLEYYRAAGVGRFLFIDNVSDDGSVEYLLEQPDCHVFSCDAPYFEQNIVPNWTNALLSVFGDGYWSLTVDADELLVYPDCERVGLRRLCDYLDETGSRGLQAPLLDMYGKGPLMEGHYEPGEPFLKACSYFDPHLPWTWPREDACPSVQLFGGVRERVFWQGRHKHQSPPCVSKVPLVKWRKGAKYLVSAHLITETPLSELQGALLHFKFMPGFVKVTELQLSSNVGVVEKSLQERTAYLDALRRNPKLTLRNAQSLRYRNSRQLVEIGWMRSSPAYQAFCGLDRPAAAPSAPRRARCRASSSSRPRPAA